VVFLSPRFRSGGGCAPSRSFWTLKVWLCLVFVVVDRETLRELLKEEWSSSSAVGGSGAAPQRLKHVARPDLFILLSSNQHTPLILSRRGLLVLLLVLSGGKMVYVRRVALTC
jgi:hypothetical protein